MTHTVAFTNIGQLVTNNERLGEGMLGVIENAGLVAIDGVVTWVGKSKDVTSHSDVATVDMHGRVVIPGFVDSHSHIMFAGDRSQEFAARMAGIPYSAGGIKTTVNATRAASDDELRHNAARLIAEMRESGTTTVEIKSGYGLDVANETRSLRIAREFTQDTTFLGAHVVPAEFSNSPDDYVDLVCEAMLNECVPYSTWIDVFCDIGAFTTEQTRRILTAGIARGLKPRIHLNQLAQGDGIAMAVELDCASADHLTYLSDDDITTLASSNTVAGLVPGAEFSTRAPQYPRARDLIDAGVSVALSPDCNPGSSYTTNMPFCIALAVREMHMSVDEAVFAATHGGAQALRRTDVGHLGIGAQADFAVLDAPHYIHLAYRPGVPLVHSTWQHARMTFTKGDRA